LFIDAKASFEDNMLEIAMSKFAIN